MCIRDRNDIDLSQLIVNSTINRDIVDIVNGTSYNNTRMGALYPCTLDKGYYINRYKSDIAGSKPFAGSVLDPEWSLQGCLRVTKPEEYAWFKYQGLDDMKVQSSGRRGFMLNFGPTDSYTCASGSSRQTFKDCTQVNEAVSSNLTFSMRAYNVDNDVAMLSTKTCHTSEVQVYNVTYITCLLYTSPSPRDLSTSRMPSSA